MNYINFAQYKIYEKNKNNFQTQEVFYCNSLITNFQNLLYQDNNLYNFHSNEEKIFKPFFFTNFFESWFVLNH